MRTALFISCCLALILFASPAFSAQDTIPPTGWQQAGPQSHAESVLNGLTQGNQDKAFKTLFSRGKYSQTMLEKVQFDYYQILKKQGKPYAYEKIIEHKVGTALVRIKYVLLFKTLPMMFDLYYYNTEKGWMLKTFTVSRDIKKIFER